jgi:hypothetical protein
VDNDSSRPAGNVLSLFADGRLIDSKEVTAAPGDHQDFIFTKLPTDATLVEARLRNGDALALDDRAYLALHQRAPSRILLVSTGNFFLLSALRLLPIQLFQATPNQLASVNADAYDIVVLDGVVPPILPRGNLLLVNPPNSPLLPSQGTVGPLRATTVQRDDPLLRYADLSGLPVRAAAKVTPPGWARVLAGDNGIPLLLVGETQGRRVATLPFALQDSALPVLPAFPILLSNLLDYLAPGQPGAIVSAPSGGLLAIQRLAQADRIDVQRPDRRVVTLPLGKSPIAAYQDVDEAGLYVVTQRAGNRVLLQQTYPVNLLSARESAIKPVAAPRFASTAGAPGLAGQPAVAPYELWPDVALLAALLLMMEWWWYHRRA